MPIDNIQTLYSILDNINMGIVLIDSGDCVVFWNNFMAKHSGIGAEELKGKNLFDVFSYLPRQWLELKLRSVKLIKNYSFISWTQRPYLFRFNHNRPITGGEVMEYMRQDCTLIPIQEGSTGKTYICITVQDMTEVAASQNKITEISDINRTLEHMTNHDSLTSIYNRAYVEKQIEYEFNKAKRYKSSFSLVMFDLDHFKTVNDTFGHLAGDEVLKRVSAEVRTHLRSTDILGRYGGEEFLILMPETKEDPSSAACERLRKTVESMIVRYDGMEISVTVSIGLVQFRPDMKDYLQVLHEADIALYHSKKSGRNAATKYKLTGCIKVTPS